MPSHSGPSPEQLMAMEMRDRLGEVKLPSLPKMSGGAEYCQRYFSCMEVFTSRFEDEKVKRRWAPVILLNLPFPMALYSVFPATFGQVVFSATFKQTCVVGDDDEAEEIEYIKTYLLFSIILSVLVLWTFAWSFLGFRYQITPQIHLPDLPDIKLGGFQILLAKYSHKGIGLRKKFTVMAPFTSLPFVFFIYLTLFFGFWLCNVVGFFVLSPAAGMRSCFESNPEINLFCRFICILYWCLFGMGLAHTVTVVYGDGIANAAKSAASKAREKTAPKTDLDVAEAAFDMFDADGSGHMETDELGQLIKKLGIEMSPAELDNVKALLDGDGEGTISKDEFLDWYEQDDEEPAPAGAGDSNGSSDEEESSDEESSDEEQEETKKRGKAKKKK